MTSQKRANVILTAVVTGAPTTYDQLCTIVNKLTPSNWGWSPQFECNDWSKRINQLSFHDGKNTNVKVDLPETINVIL